MQISHLFFRHILVSFEQTVYPISVGYRLLDPVSLTNLFSTAQRYTLNIFSPRNDRTGILSFGVKYHKFRNGVNRPSRSKLPDILRVTLLNGTLMLF